MKEIKKLNINMFWQRVDNLMRKNYITASKLSEDLGHSKSYFSSCKISPNFKVSVVLELAQALGCSSDYLLGLTDTFSPIESDSMSKADTVILSILKLLSESQKLKVIEYISSLSPQAGKYVSLYKDDITVAISSDKVDNKLIKKELHDISDSINKIKKSVEKLEKLNS